MAGIDRVSELSWKSGIGDQIRTEVDQSSSGYDFKSESVSFTDEHLPSDIVPQLVLLRFNLTSWHTYTEKERNERLNGIDAIELLDTVKAVESNLATLRIENLVLVNFLEKNDAKLLVGYEKKREVRQDNIDTSASMRTQSRPSTMGHSTMRHSTMRPSSMGRSISGRSTLGRSITSGRSPSSRRPFDYGLNYEAKREMAEKLLIEVEKRSKLAEKKGKNEIKELRVKIEELNLRNQETIETQKNFQLHFDASIHSFTEQQLYAKLRHFMNNWLRNANTLIGNMRLEIQNLDSKCNEYNLQIIAKSELRKMLTGADFEQLRIQRKELLNQVVLKEQHAAELKQNFGKATVKLVGQKTALLDDEKSLKRMQHRIEVLQHLTDGNERELDTLIKDTAKEKERIAQLRKRLENVKAPSVNDYMKKKENIAKLEKEIKIVKRKINLLTIN